jgi:hypothetical protein
MIESFMMKSNSFGNNTSFQMQFVNAKNLTGLYLKRKQMINSRLSTWKTKRSFRSQYLGKKKDQDFAPIAKLFAIDNNDVRMV